MRSVTGLSPLFFGTNFGTTLKKLHRHRPQIEKISETFFHAASMGQWYSGCLDKQISQHLPTQLTWANILWKRVLFCLVEWSKRWCVWTQRFACRIDITEVASKKCVFPCRPRFPTLEPWNRIWRQSWFPTIQASLATFMHRYCLVLRNGPVTERFVWLNVRMIWKHVLYSLLFCLMGRHQIAYL